MSTETTPQPESDDLPIRISAADLIEHATTVNCWYACAQRAAGIAAEEVIKHGSLEAARTMLTERITAAYEDGDDLDPSDQVYAATHVFTDTDEAFNAYDDEPVLPPFGDEVTLAHFILLTLDAFTARWWSRVPLTHDLVVALANIQTERGLGEDYTGPIYTARTGPTGVQVTHPIGFDIASLLPGADGTYELAFVPMLDMDGDPLPGAPLVMVPGT